MYVGYRYDMMSDAGERACVYVPVGGQTRRVGWLKYSKVTDSE